MARPTSTAASFLEILTASGLLPPDELAQAQSFISNDADAKAAAQTLVQRQLLTRWQAAQILAGRTALTLGKYRLLERLGQGGMGNVYLAEHRQMKRRVAIKTLAMEAGQGPAAEAQLLAEAQAIAALDHRNIIHAFDLEADGDLHFLVMEYIEGEDLQQLVEREGPLPFAKAADFISQAADGLAHVHSRGLVHRDVKPANLLLDRQGTIKILDLGLAHRGDQDGQQCATNPATLGTVDYLAPEQAMGRDNADQRADIYSLGCTFYFLLTGQPPFPEGSLTERLAKHQTDEPRSILKLRPNAPHDLVKVCRKMMSKKPDHRFASAADAAAAIRSWQPDDGDLKTPSKDASDATSRGNSGMDTARVAASQSRTPQRGMPIVAAPLNAVATSLGETALPRAVPLASLNDSPSRVSAATPRSGMPVAAPPASPGTSGIGNQRSGGFSTPNTDVTRSGPVSTGFSKRRAEREMKKRRLSSAMYIGLGVAWLAVVLGIVVIVLNSSKPKTGPELATDGKPARRQPTQATPSDATGEPRKDPSTAAPPNSPVQPGPQPAAPPTIASPGTSPATQPEPKAPLNPPAADPFKDLPWAVDLPAINSIAAVALGKVHIPPTAGLEIELSGGATAMKGSEQFRLARQISDGSATNWLLTSDGGSSSRRGPIAVIARNASDLSFRWTDEAANAPADFLRNCALKLSVGNNHRSVALRKPTAVAALPIDLERTRTIVSLDGEFLPDQDHLFLEILGLDAKDVTVEIGPTKIVPFSGESGRRQASDDQATIYAGDQKSKPLGLRLSGVVRERGPPRLEISAIYLSNDKWAPLEADRLVRMMNEHKLTLQRLSRQLSVLRDEGAIAAAKKQSEIVQGVVKGLEDLKSVCERVHEKATIQYRLFHRAGPYEVTISSTRPGDAR